MHLFSNVSSLKYLKKVNKTFKVPESLNHKIPESLNHKIPESLNHKLPESLNHKMNP